MHKLFAALNVGLACAFTLNAGAATSEPSESPGIQLRAATYDGTWKGTVNCLHDPGIWPDDECAVQFTFVIQGPSIEVEQVIRSKKGSETKSTINPGRFRFVKVSSNAVALSIESGKDEDGTWVETWSFTMTLEDRTHMLVHWTRVVNNIDMPKEKEGSKFSSVGMGEFTRVAASK